jgi:tetratricopeptide (TPR) repeat protein
LFALTFCPAPPNLVAIVVVSASVSLPAERSLAGQQVALVGKLTLLSRRDTRSIIERLGGTFSPDITPRTTVVVMGGEVPELPPNVHRVLSEDDLCREAGLPDVETLRARYFSARDLRGMYPIIRDEHLRYFEKLGLIHPVAGRYAFTQLHVVKQAAAELQRGVSLGSVLRDLASADRGQLAFDFQPPRSERLPARVVSLPATKQEPTLFPPEHAQELASANYALAAKYFLEGAELDDGEERNLEAAAAAYRRALLFDAHLVPALVNLANIHYERDELVEAEALYEKAARVDAECFEASFNLGNIHHDLARYPEAVAAYRDALAINPGYPEAHFYLAVTLEKLGRSIEAKPHWKQYRELAPEGEFAELAKEFSD